MKALDKGHSIPSPPIEACVVNLASGSEMTAANITLPHPMLGTKRRSSKLHSSFNLSEPYCFNPLYS
jgi:hypothetical protein